jgi:hypothetical protein
MLSMAFRGGEQAGERALWVFGVEVRRVGRAAHRLGRPAVAGPTQQSTERNRNGRDDDVRAASR